MAICGHCKQRDVSVAHVKACAKARPSVVVHATNPAPFAEDPPPYFKPGVTPAEVAKAREVVLTPLQLADQSKVVPWVIETAPKPKTLAEEPEEGVYSKDGEIYKVIESELGRWYAKRHNGGGVWAYEGRAPLYDLTSAHKITAEEAARFGHLTGTCVYCQRRLTDERSIRVGYGPTCATNYGLPWGEQ